MTELVPADQIEQIVGARRHPHQHLGRAVSAEQTVYILHSEECRNSGIDLRDCPYSRCLDNGINPDWWGGSYLDEPVALACYHDQLIPVTPSWLFENPEPPIPPEPTGVDVLVLDASNQTWCKSGRRDAGWKCINRQEHYANWDDMVREFGPVKVYEARS